MKTKREPQTIALHAERFVTDGQRRLRDTLDTVASHTAIRVIELFRSDYERLRRMVKARRLDTLTYRGITLSNGRMRVGRADGRKWPPT